jgi:hypothetical protein
MLASRHHKSRDPTNALSFQKVSCTYSWAMAREDRASPENRHLLSPFMFSAIELCAVTLLREK